MRRLDLDCPLATNRSFLLLNCIKVVVVVEAVVEVPSNDTGGQYELVMWMIELYLVFMKNVLEENPGNSLFFVLNGNFHALRKMSHCRIFLVLNGIFHA